MQFPFNEGDQLCDLPEGPNARLPGQPRISFKEEPEKLYRYLKNTLCTPELDSIASRLWLLSTKSAAHISELHYQKIKGREIILTESAHLHLLWIDGRIFLKPLPRYLLSYDFWQRHLLPDFSAKNYQPYEHSTDREIVTSAALGLLRSYLFLIKYPSDLDIAVQYGLVPFETTFESFCNFSSQFHLITDAEVAGRYQYGEIRLARLNHWSKILLRRWNYETMNWQYGQYFQRFYGPLLFTFAFFSVSLSALQVEMAVESMAPNQRLLAEWPAFPRFSRIFSVLSLAVVGFPFLCVLAMLIGKPLMELRYALTH